MNILVINLTRFGDLLQSAAAVRALAGGGKHRLGVVCLENFTAGAELLPDVDAVFPLPASTILKLCNADGGPGQGGTGHRGTGKPGTGWIGGLGCLYAWAGRIRSEFPPDAVCNISPSTPSCLLGRLLADGRELSGFTIDAFGFSHATSLWASFIQGASAARTTSPYNIVDLFRKVACPRSGSSDASLLPVETDAVAAMRERLAAFAPEPPAGFAALQLGASADTRRWPVEFFARTGDALWQEHRLLPVLVGTKSEIPLGEEYASRASRPFASLMGQTGLTELAAALTASALCVSNDTGTLHLASGLGVPAIGIFLATAQPWDTGPYAAGSRSLEPDLPCHPCNFGTACPNDFACHTAIRPETVIRQASALLARGRHRPENFAAAYAEQPSASGARIWETVRDAYGFADLASLSGHEGENRTQWMRLQRHLYRQFFDRTGDWPFTPEQPPTPFSLDANAAAPLVRACEETLALLDAMEQQAAMLAHNPLPIVRDRFSRTWQRLTALLASQPEFSAIAFCWRSEAMRQTDLDQAIPLVQQYKAFFAHLRSLLG